MLTPSIVRLPEFHLRPQGFEVHLFFEADNLRRWVCYLACFQNQLKFLRLNQSGRKRAHDQCALTSSRKSPMFYWWKILATISHLPSILTSEWKSVNPRPCQSSRTTRTVAAVPTTSITSTSYLVSGAAPS